MGVEEVDIYPPDPNVIKAIESLLEQAKTGKIRAIAYCTVKKDCTSSGWEGVLRFTSMIGEIGLLRARMEIYMLREFHPELFDDRDI